MRKSKIRSALDAGVRNLLKGPEETDSKMDSSEPIRLVSRSTISLPPPSLLPLAKGQTVRLLVWSPMSGLPLRATMSLKLAAGGIVIGRVGHARVVVAHVLDEDENQHTVLVLACIHAAAKLIAAARPEGGVKLGFLQRHRYFLSRFAPDAGAPRRDDLLIQSGTHATMAHRCEHLPMPAPAPQPPVNPSATPGSMGPQSGDRSEALFRLKLGWPVYYCGLSQDENFPGHKGPTADNEP